MKLMSDGLLRCWPLPGCMPDEVRLIWKPLAETALRDEYWSVNTTIYLLPKSAGKCSEGMSTGLFQYRG
jgi:hypothetical protein